MPGIFRKRPFLARFLRDCGYALVLGAIAFAPMFFLAERIDGDEWAKSGAGVITIGLFTAVKDIVLGRRSAQNIPTPTES